MVLAANLGYPRFAAKRELKRALESYWSGKISAADLITNGADYEEKSAIQVRKGSSG
jgi:5-methyltetrahydropteroyltriglutamate--homocysteine methyltransferase